MRFDAISALRVFERAFPDYKNLPTHLSCHISGNSVVLTGTVYLTRKKSKRVSLTLDDDQIMELSVPQSKPLDPDEE